MVGGGGEEHVAPKHSFAHNKRFWNGNRKRIINYKLL